MFFIPMKRFEIVSLLQRIYGNEKVRFLINGQDGFGILRYICTSFHKH